IAVGPGDEPVEARGNEHMSGGHGAWSPLSLYCCETEGLGVYTADGVTAANRYGGVSDAARGYRLGDGAASDTGVDREAAGVCLVTVYELSEGRLSNVQLG